MRRSRRTKGSLRAWAVGIGAPVVGAFGLFSLLPYEVMRSPWPLGIQQTEVEWYQRHFDRRPSEQAEDRVEIFQLDSGLSDAGGSLVGVHAFRGAGHESRVEVAPDGSDLILRFPADSLMTGREVLVLRPVGAEAIKFSMVQWLAAKNGVLSPELRLVRLMSAGQDRGLHLVEERISGLFLERQGSPEADLLGEPSSLGGPSIAAQRAAETEAMNALKAGDHARVDQRMLAFQRILQKALALPSRAAQTLAFDRSRGGFIPVMALLNAPAKTDEAAAEEGPLVSRAALQGAKQAIRADSAELLAWSDELIAQWAPAFAGGSSAAFAQARLTTERDAFLAELSALDPTSLASPEVLASATKVALDPWLKEHLRGDSIVFERGVYKLDHDVEMPKGMALVLQKGTRFFIAPGKSLLVRGPLRMNGTGLNPVFIRPMDDTAAYGVIAVNGDGQTPVVLRNVRMSGGSTAWVGQHYHSGMLSFHDCAVTIEDCSIGMAHGEDQVNVKRGEARITNCLFAVTADDMVDIDRAKANVADCTFQGADGTGQVTNGDGLDLSGAHVVISGCSFTGLKDKGVSAGEGSQVYVKGCRMEACTIGLASKDLSLVYVEGSTFMGNATAFSAYRKKPIFGGGRIVSAGQVLTGNFTDKMQDPWSEVRLVPKLDEQALASFKGR